MATNKHVMAILASIVAMGLSISGCGSNSGSPDVKNSNTDSKITLTYLHRLPDGDGMTLVNDIIKNGILNIQISTSKPQNLMANLLK